jgi:hypothetical protein
MFRLSTINWSAILLASLVAIIGWQFYSLASERDDAVKELAEVRHALEVAKAEHVGKLAALKAEGERNMQTQKDQHIKDIQHIGQLYGKVINNDQKNINRYRNDTASRVRELQAANDSLRRSQNDEGRLTGNDSNPATTRPGEESIEFYQKAYAGSQQYIETLEQAGAICAADYNRCFAYVKSEQGRLGVELLSNP